MKKDILRRIAAGLECIECGKPACDLVFVLGYGQSPLCAECLQKAPSDDLAYQEKKDAEAESYFFNL